MKKKHFYLFAGLAGALLVASCSPQLVNMPIDMRQASQSGLDLGGKSFSVVYLDNGFKADSCLNHGLAEGFAMALEKDYFRGEKKIDLYKMPFTEGGDYSSKDTLVNLVMDSQRDVVFLLDTPNFKSMSLSTPVKGKRNSKDSALVATAYMGIEQDFYIYDSMNSKKDEVIHKTMETTLTQEVYLPADYTEELLLSRLAGSLGPEGVRAGRNMAQPFLPTWETENYGLIYYDKGDWLEAAQAAYDFRWEEALDIWLGLVQSQNTEQRSCAAYNISLACYMLGNYQLALDWLDRSDREQPIDISRTLRSRIQKRMK